MQTNKKLEIANMVNEDSYSFEHKLNSTLRRRTGSYYTSLELTIPMVNELIDNLPKEKRQGIHKLKFLEPCVGTGNFVFAYIIVASEQLDNKQVEELLRNIYVCDINKQALEKYKEQLKFVAKEHYNINLTDNYFNSHIGNGLLFDITSDNPEYISIDSVFGEGSHNSFDIVVTNPPYKNLKAELGHYESARAKNIDKNKYDTVSLLAKSILPLSTSGTLNLYKLFVEEIIDKYASKDALVSLLVPTSILTDKTCENIRRKIVNNHHIISVKNIPENNRFIDAQQALTAILIDKNNDSDDKRLTSICKSYMVKDEELASIYVKELATQDNGYTILALSQHELQILQKMTRYPKIKHLHFMVNLRGELDLTVNKNSIVTQKTPYKLLRGRNISYYHTISTAETDYVAEEFVDKSAKRVYVDGERLACQQISNIAKERRLTFTKVEPESVLANSCNFIAVRPNSLNIDVNYVIGLLNSKLMNWYFKLHSSNNHINNYEIDNFPVPIKGHAIKQISQLVAKMNITDTKTSDRIDELVCELFGVTDRSDVSMKAVNITKQDVTVENLALKDLQHIIPQLQISDVRDMITDLQSVESTILQYVPSLSKFDKKVTEGILDKYKKLSDGNILNHTTFKLSDLDLEMVRPIPQGGNWKDIPAKTVNKSRRLKRITETGGRTTLYGRLHYHKPSYTITTYFNRPGNGTYVHPKHDRVLSVREAARLQAFPNDYYFYGNKTQLLKQIGNAVPALLAYQIGRKIKNKLGNVKSVDLFCGAGGLTSGLRSAGIETVLCTDFDEAACVTIKINNPESEVICGDITNKAVKSSIIQSAIKNNVDIVCGGPPCQGFSMAGYRAENDPRNQLFKEFVKVVEETKPKVVLFENVEGILTFKGGETYDAIHELFAGIGYRTEGRLLKIDKYGVPQKRKRVIIMCARDDTGIDPSDLYPDEITADDTSKVTVADTISDLELVECDDNARYDGDVRPRLSNYNRMLNGLITAQEFLETLSSKQVTNLNSEQLSLLAAD